MSHPNIDVLKKLYSHFSAGQLDLFLSLCDDKCQFIVPGKSALAGKYDKSGFKSKFVARLMALTEGSLALATHDFMATDQHGVVLASQSFVRNGEKIELRTVHVWRFHEGKPIAWYEYPRDLYRFDELFG